MNLTNRQILEELYRQSVPGPADAGQIGVRTRLRADGKTGVHVTWAQAADGVTSHYQVDVTGPQSATVDATGKQADLSIDTVPGDYQVRVTPLAADGRSGNPGTATFNIATPPPPPPTPIADVTNVGVTLN